MLGKECCFMLCRECCFMLWKNVVSCSKRMLFHAPQRMLFHAPQRMLFHAPQRMLFHAPQRMLFHAGGGPMRPLCEDTQWRGVTDRRTAVKRAASDSEAVPWNHLMHGPVAPADIPGRGSVGPPGSPTCLLASASWLHTVCPPEPVIIHHQ